jgi:hypothetical protein
MKKLQLSKLWLWRYRFYIGYSLLAVLFVLLLTLVYLQSSRALTPAEMESIANSNRIAASGFININSIDFPYHLLQKASIWAFGPTVLAIKLPSLVLAAITALVLVALINRWHRTNIAIISCILVIPTVFFLSLASQGSPAITLALYPALLLWLGSKILAQKYPPAIYYFSFVTTLALACYTPYLIYFAVLLPLICLIHPHIRLHVKTFSKVKLLLMFLVFSLIISPIIIWSFTSTSNVINLIWADNVSMESILANFTSVFYLFLDFTTATVAPFYSQLIGLPLTIVALVGLVNIWPQRHTARNQITTIFFVFAAILTAIDTSFLPLLLTPLVIFIASGINFILKEWYSLFPVNPYARGFGSLVILVFATIIVYDNLSYFIASNYYAPNIVNHTDATLPALLGAIERLPSDPTVVIASDQSIDTFRIASKRHSHIIVSTVAIPEAKYLIFTSRPDEVPVQFSLQQILTSDRYSEADLLYIYSRDI